MNREQAETLLAELVADELAEPKRAALLAYLKTDPALNERLGDMRAAARLVRAGLAAEAEAALPMALDDAQRAELLALAEQEPITATEPQPPESGTGAGSLPGVLFSFRVAGAAAACVALGVGLIGLTLPEGGAALFEPLAQDKTTSRYSYGYSGADAAEDAADDAADFFASAADAPSQPRRPRTPVIVAEARAAGDRIALDGSALLEPDSDFDGGVTDRNERFADRGGDRDPIVTQDGELLYPGLASDPSAFDIGPAPGIRPNTGASIDYGWMQLAGPPTTSLQHDLGVALGTVPAPAEPVTEFFSLNRAELPTDGRDWDLAAAMGISEQSDFSTAPSFDLNEALSNTNSGGRSAAGGGGGNGAFGDAGGFAEGQEQGQGYIDEADQRWSSDPLQAARERSVADKMAEAEEAVRNGQDHLARQLYEEAALLSPGRPEIAQRLTDVRGRITNGLRPVDPLTDRAADITIARGETASRYDQAMQRAQAALANNEYDAATDAVIEARTVLNANRSTFSEAERSEMVGRAAQMQSGVNEARAVEYSRIASAAERQQAESERSAVREAEGRRTAEVQERLRNARDLQAENRYDEALDELDAALFLDPNNAAVGTLRDLIQDVTVASQAVRLRRDLDLMRSNQQLLNDEAVLENPITGLPEVDESIIPYDELLTYPGEWPELTQMRLADLEDDAGESEANRTTRLALRRVLSVDFEEQSLGSIIDYLRDATGANITVNWPALEISDVSPDTLVSVSLQRVPGEQLLKLVLEQAGATAFEDDKPGYTIVDGIVQISSLIDLQPPSEVKLYDIRDWLSTRPGETRGEVIDELLQLIQDTVGDPDDWEDEDFTIQELNGNLIVKVRPDAHRELVALLRRVMPDQTAERDAEPPAAPPVNPWVLTEHDALSTFALDTDTASYELARRHILDQSRLPAVASVRMEEFVNRFDYQYPSGRGLHDTFTVHAEAGDAPFAGDGVLLVKVGVRGRVVARDQMKPAHYVFVIDASGSMAREDRLPLVQRSLAMLLGQLGERDTVSLVSYDTRPFLLLEHASVGEPERILDAAATIQTGGSTNLTDGLALGYQVAARHFEPGSVNRVVLCSDGVANVGNDEAQQMLDAVDAYRRQGVTLMTVGVGVDGVSAAAQAQGDEQFNDGLLEQLANRGDGRYVYLGSVADAQRQLVDDLAATRPTIAYDAKIQVAFDPTRVRRYRLIGYENRDIADADFRNDAVDAGEVGSGQSATALYEIELYPAPGMAGRRAALPQDRAGRDLGTVFVRYRDAATNEVRETATALGADIVQDRTPREDPRFYLAACAAEFAELLRESEHAADGDMFRLQGVARQVAEALPLNTDAAELAELIGRARGLPRAGR